MTFQQTLDGKTTVYPDTFAGHERARTDKRRWVSRLKMIPLCIACHGKHRNYACYSPEQLAKLDAEIKQGVEKILKILAGTNGAKARWKKRGKP